MCQLTLRLLLAALLLTGCGGTALRQAPAAPGAPAGPPPGEPSRPTAQAPPAVFGQLVRGSGIPVTLRQGEPGRLAAPLHITWRQVGEFDRAAALAPAELGGGVLFAWRLTRLFRGPDGAWQTQPLLPHTPSNWAASVAFVPGHPERMAVWSDGFWLSKDGGHTSSP